MRAICTAERPTPPRHPVIKTDWPALTLRSPSAVPGCQAHNGQGGRLLERDGWRLEPNVFFVCNDVFGERTRLADGGDAEDFIAHIEPFHPRPDGFDHASEIMAQAARKPEPGNAFISPRRIFQSIGLAAAALT